MNGVSSVPSRFPEINDQGTLLLMNEVRSAREAAAAAAAADAAAAAAASLSEVYWSCFGWDARTCQLTLLCS